MPPKRKAKDELVRTHVSHLKTQNANQNAPRAVKQPVLSEAYPASIRSIRDLEIVSAELFNFVADEDVRS